MLVGGESFFFVFFYLPCITIYVYTALCSYGIGGAGRSGPTDGQTVGYSGGMVIFVLSNVNLCYNARKKYPLRGLC